MGREGKESRVETELKRGDIDLSDESFSTNDRRIHTIRGPVYGSA
jgi:hypothetical protein